MLINDKLRKNLSENGMGFLEKNGFRNKVIRKRLMKVFAGVRKKNQETFKMAMSL